VVTGHLVYRLLQNSGLLLLLTTKTAVTTPTAVTSVTDEADLEAAMLCHHTAVFDTYVSNVFDIYVSNVFDIYVSSLLPCCSLWHLRENNGS